MSRAPSGAGAGTRTGTAEEASERVGQRAGEEVEAAHRPAPADRLEALPWPLPGSADGAPDETDPETDPGPAAGHPPGDRPMTAPRFPRHRDRIRGAFLKQVEWFFTGLAKVGRSHRLTKLQGRDLDEAENRIGALEGDIGDLRGGQAGLLDAATARVDALEAALGTRFDTRLETGLETLGARLARLEAGEDIAAVARRLEARLEALETRLAETAERGAAERALAARASTDLARRLDLLRHGPSPAASTAAAGEDPPEDPPGLTALLDSFYNRLEARFRGSREEIQRRLATYLPEAEAAVARTGKPVLDLGCGRGEWVELLTARGLPASGIDLNPLQIAEGRALGLDLAEGDALADLAARAPGSLAMVSAHHLVEHLPFPATVALMRDALAALAPGGLLLLETPNAHNLLVSARSFHVDPTHIRPLPEEVLVTLAETLGYHPVEARALHPHEKLETFFRERRIDPEIAGLLYGPQDLALIAAKPAPWDTLTPETGEG